MTAVAKTTSQPIRPDYFSIFSGYCKGSSGTVKVLSLLKTVVGLILEQKDRLKLSERKINTFTMCHSKLGAATGVMILTKFPGTLHTLFVSTSRFFSATNSNEASGVGEACIRDSMDVISDVGTIVSLIHSVDLIRLGPVALSSVSGVTQISTLCYDALKIWESIWTIQKTYIDEEASLQKKAWLLNPFKQSAEMQAIHQKETRRKEWISIGKNITKTLINSAFLLSFFYGIALFSLTSTLVLTMLALLGHMWEYFYEHAMTEKLNSKEVKGST